MQIKKLNKNIQLLSNSTEKGEYFPKSRISFEEKGNNIFQWFYPNNNYPEWVMREINKGTTLESILFEDLIYKTGSGFSAQDKTFENYINNEKINSNQVFKDVFKNSNDHYNKLGNIFVEITINEGNQLVSLKTIQPQKNRLSKKGTVLIYPDWFNFKENKLGQGREAVKETLKKDTNLYNTIEKLILQKIKDN